ncbi:MAG: ArnT family glycosyltransferase [Armatimonadota bacterium]
MPLVLTLVLATGLRVVGLGWGLPDERHLFSYHPDEYFSLMAVWSFSLGDGDLNPHYFNYGTLYFHLVLATAVIAGHAPFSSPAEIAQRMGALVLDARMVTVVLGVLTVVLVYLIGKELCDRRVGLWAALVLAITPLHVVHGHYATVDVPATFWMTLCLLCAAKILRGRGPAGAILSEAEDLASGTAAEEPNARPFGAACRTASRTLRGTGQAAPYLWAGVAAGLAAATKYNGALAILFPLVAHVAVAVRGREERKLWRLIPDRRVGLCVAAMVVAFLIACPWPLLSFGEWWGSSEQFNSVAYEVHHMRVGEEPALSATPHGLIFHLTRSLAYGCTWPLLVFMLAGVGRALLRRGEADRVLLVFLFAWYVMIGLAKVRYMRYTIPLLPVLALLAGSWLHELLSSVQRRRRWAVVAVAVLCMASVLFAAAYSASYDRALAAEPEQDRALEALSPHLGPYTVVGTVWPVWFCHPPLDRVNGGRILNANPVWRHFSRPRADLRAVGYVAEPQADIVIVTRVELRDHELAQTPQWQQISQAEREGAPLELGHVLAEEAALRRFMDLEAAPQDWLYPFPGIRAFRPTSAGR